MPCLQEAACRRARCNIKLKWVISIVPCEGKEAGLKGCAQTLPRVLPMMSKSWCYEMCHLTWTTQIKNLAAALRVSVGYQSYSKQTFPIFILKDNVSDPVDLGFKAAVEYFEEVTLVKIRILYCSIHAQNTFHKTSHVHSLFQKSTFRYLNVFRVFRISASILPWLIFSIYYFLLNLLGKKVIILYGLLQHSNRKWWILRIHMDFREQ